MKRNHLTYLVIAAIVLIAGVFVLPIRIPYTIATYGQITPAQEWVLLQGDNGMITSVLRDHRSGTVRSYTVTQIERGEALSFSIADLQTNEGIAAGDTIAWTSSTDVEYSMASLVGALEVAEAALAAAQSGEKTSLVDEADQRLAYAKKAVDEQQKLYQRQSELHKKKLVSDEEYELSRDQLDLLKINVEIAEAQLSAVSTGARAEEIRQRMKEIGAIKGEIEAVRNRMTLSTHVAPIDGVLRSSRAADTLLIVEDTTEYLIMMPVPLHNYTMLANCGRIEFHAYEIDLKGSGQTLPSDDKIHYLDGAAVMFIPARITEHSNCMPSGLIISCKIVCDRVSLLTYITRYFREILQ